MHLTKYLAAGAVLVALAAVSGCGSDSGSATAGSSGDGQEAADNGLPRVGTMRGAQEFIAGAGLPCTDWGTDRGDNRLPIEGFVDSEWPDDSEEQKTFQKSWGVKEKGVCGNRYRESWLVYLPKDMKTFQQVYRDDVLEASKTTDNTTLRSGRFLIGADFVVDPTSRLRESGLLGTGLLVLNCDPDLKPASGYVMQDALVDGCVLTNYLPG
ncbi:hypothetical protein [Streptomyces sp. cmx-18-6]|uniref:hypothetical protein n=1 Tax=Streptomyces sp. cmx-18-6 TaxID=2790930 RepID=UPI0039805CA4